MADSSLNFQPMNERREWADLQPLPPPATPESVVEIGRDALLGDLMDYFWAAVAHNEFSERVLNLTGEIIRDLNSSNYSVWEWRWRCVQALGGVQAHAAEEKALMRSVATANPKNYQLWNYRRRVALALGSTQAEEELDFSAACLTHDAKNYHAWAHRQAVLLALGTPALWSAELGYTERLLRDDVRNNSAWNQRIFVLRNAPPSAVGPPHEVYDREVDFAAAMLRLAPHNESAWEALRGLATAAAPKGPGAVAEEVGAASAAAAEGALGLSPPPDALAADPRYIELCREVLDAAPGCAPALSLLADVFLEQAALLEAAARAATATAAGASSSASGMPAVDARAAAVGAVTARRLARQLLERQAVADPIKRPYLRLELAALGSSLEGR